MSEIASFWSRRLSAGITEGMSPNDRNKIHVTRGSSWALVLLGPVFMVLNFAQGSHHLGLVNLSSTLLGLACLGLLRWKIVPLAALVLVIGGEVLFFFSGLFFRNGMEYTLLLGMMGAVFMFDTRLTRFSLAAAGGIGFLVVKVLHFDPAIPGQLPAGRLAVNLAIFLLSYYLILEIFRAVHGNYQRAIEQKNINLAESQRRIDEEHAKLQARTMELQKANEAKEKLFSVVAHDLRGPVGNLKVAMELLGRRVLSPSEFETMIPDLKTGVDHAYECLDTLLLWSSAQLRTHQPVFSEVRLADAAREGVTLYAATAARKKITVQVTLPEDAVVWADAIQVASIFRNLLSNALKFTPVGGLITLSAQAEREVWRISVSDTGVGMVDAKASQLFQTDPVSSTNGTENEGGFGLGLQICREFVQNHGGKIGVDSREGQGSTFHFTLPRILSGNRSLARP